MSTEVVTLIVACIAAVSSVASLFISARLVLLKEKRMLLWQKELERIFEIEERAGTAKEIALSYSSSEVLEKEFPPLHDKLRHDAGRLGRYPSFSKALKDLNHACAVTVAEKVKHGDSREWQEKIMPAYVKFLRECDEITNRKKT